MEKIRPKQKIFFSPKIPGDKSISHRSLMLAGLAKGISRFQNLSFGEDVISTQKVLSELGVEFALFENSLQVFGVDKKFKQPRGSLDCGNAGTLMRLMMGVLAGQDFESTLIGDESLSRRPMKRVSDPLSKLDARFELTENNFAPIRVLPSTIEGCEVFLETASAQVKSAVLLASLYARHHNVILSGKIQSRDHTERLLQHFGADLKVTADHICLRAGQNLKSVEYFIPNDISAASFWLAAGVLAQESDVVIENVGLNPSRTGFVDVLKRAGAQIEVQMQTSKPEPMGRLRTRSSSLKAFEISKKEIPSLIDEIPILCLIATQAKGVSRIFGADELRFKESDRLETTRAALEALGATMEVIGGDIIIAGNQKLRGGFVQTQKDHRIAMMAVIASFCVGDEIQIEEVESTKISDPYFMEQMVALDTGRTQ